jgi:hypothetical protein
MILIPPCQCRASWPFTAEWLIQETHIIHLTSDLPSFFLFLTEKTALKEDFMASRASRRRI